MVSEMIQRLKDEAHEAHLDVERAIEEYHNPRCWLVRLLQRIFGKCSLE